MYTYIYRRSSPVCNSSRRRLLTFTSILLVRAGCAGGISVLTAFFASLKFVYATRHRRRNIQHIAEHFGESSVHQNFRNPTHAREIKKERRKILSSINSLSATATTRIRSFASFSQPAVYSRSAPTSSRHKETEDRVYRGSVCLGWLTISHTRYFPGDVYSSPATRALSLQQYSYHIIYLYPCLRL